MNSGDRIDTTVCTIVVSHNSREVIADCLASIRASIHSTNTILVDNDSTDGTVEFVSKNFPEVIISAGENLGFPGGCNEGMRHANADAAAFFFLNPDAVVSPSCIDLLLNALNSNAQLAVVSPTVINRSSGDVEYAGAELDFENMRFQVLKDVYREFEQVIITGRPAGAAMMVRRSALSQVGTFDATYFLYWEECELAFRLTQNGLLVGYVPNATASHHTSYSTGGLGSRIYEYYFTRNFLRLVADVSGRSKWQTLRRVMPSTLSRLQMIASKRSLVLLVEALHFDALGVADFLRSRTGPRSSLFSQKTGQR
jgi:GT2 family glycosyltransferase